MKRLNLADEYPQESALHQRTPRKNDWSSGFATSGTTLSMIVSIWSASNLLAGWMAAVLVMSLSLADRENIGDYSSPCKTIRPLSEKRKRPDLGLVLGSFWVTLCGVRGAGPAPAPGVSVGRAANQARNEIGRAHV